MPNLWKGLLLLLILLLSISSAAADDSSKPVLKSGVDIREQTDVSEAATIHIIPDTAIVGSTYTILISGLHSGESIAVGILFQGQEVYHVEQTADSRGRVEIQIYTEHSDPIGSYDVEVVNAKGAVIAKTILTVTEAPGLHGTVTIDPQEAEAGTVFNLTISDVQAFVDLQVLFRDSSGTVVYSTLIRADDTGLANAEFPSGAIAAGTYAVSVVLQRDHTIEVASGELTVLEKTYTVTTTVDPTELRPNRDISVSIEGLEASSTATADIVSTDGTSIHSEDLSADENGAASFTYTLPADAAQGDYSVHILQNDEIVSEASFVVAIPEFAVTISPENGAPNTNFLVNISGLNENEAVKVELVDGSGILQSVSTTADTDGNARALIGQRIQIEVGIHAIRVMRGDTIAFGKTITIYEQVPSPEATVETTQNISVSVTPTSGPIPTNYTFHVEGLVPNTDVTMGILFNGTEVFSSSGTTDGNGVFEANASSETTDAEGQYTVEFRVAGEVVGSADFYIGNAPPQTKDSAQTSTTGEAQVTVTPEATQEAQVTVTPEATQEAQATETPEAPKAVAISVNPSAAVQGDRVEIVVRNLDAGETVTIEMRYGQDVVYSTEQVANDTGAIGIAVGIEDSDPTGVYGIVVLRGEELIANAALNVVRDKSSIPASPATVTVTPQSGPIGTDYVIVVTDLNAGETVQANLEFEGKTVLTLERSADASGKAVIEVGSQLGDKPGEYAIHIVREDGTELDSSLVVEDSILMGDAQISIDPQSGVLETDHHITVTHLLPNEQVTLNIEFDGNVVYTTDRTADKDGTVSIDITSQQGDKFGTYDVVVVRQNGAESHASFVVESPAAFEVTVDPDVVAIGDSFSVHVSGLMAGETASLSISTDNNVVYETKDQADTDGNVVFKLFTEDGDAPGSSSAVVTRENGDTASAGFEIVPAAKNVKITVSPASGAIGTNFNFAISGLDANSHYDFVVKLDGNVVYSSSLDSDKSGESSVALTTDDSDKAGQYSLVIMSNNTEIASINFVLSEAAVTGDNFSNVQISIEPASGTRSTVRVVTITGLPANQAITLNEEFGGKTIYETNLTADADGSASINLQSNPDDPIGEYSVNVLVDNKIIATQTLSVTEGEIAATEVPNTSNITAINGPVYAGRINADTGELQFDFSGNAGDTVLISLSSNEFDTYLTLKDNNGHELASNDNFGDGSDSQLAPYTLPYSGDYTVVVSSADFENAGKTVFGNFVLLIEPYAPVATQYGDTSSLSFDESTISQFVSFEGKAGDVVSLAVDSHDSIDTVLTVIAPSGMPIAHDDDSGSAYDPEIMGLVLPESGAYIVMLRAFKPQESGEADLSIKLDDKQTIDSGTHSVHLSSKHTRDLLVFEGHAGETIRLTIQLDSGQVGNLNIEAEQNGISLLNYGTRGLPDTVTLGFVVPDDGIVSIHIEDEAVIEAVLSFSIERD